MPQISVLRLATLSLLVGAVFFTELGGARLWDRDEPRNSRASHEMLARGDWIVPTFNGELRDHKPILLYWGQMASYLALGESEFTARLPSALGALLTVIAVLVLGSRLSGQRTGINRDGYWAAGVLATCLFFVMAGRAATPDACLVAFSTLGITALVISSLSPALPYSSGRVGKARWIPAMFGYTMLGLAALAKGPVGVILPLVVVHTWWLICYRLQTSQANDEAPRAWSVAQKSIAALHEGWKIFNPLQCFRAIWCLRAIPGLLLCLLVAAPWYVAVGYETDGAFLRGFFLDHNVGRAMNSMEGHNGSIFFYPIAFLIGTFPWSLWLIPILLWCRRASRECVLQKQMVVLAGTWVGVYVVAFSIASTKLPSYITPCYAGAALAVGGYLRQFESTWQLPSLSWRRTAYGLTMVTGIVITGGLLWLSSLEHMPLVSRAALCGVAIFATGLVAAIWERKQKLHWVPATWLVGAAAFQIILFGFGAKSVDAYRDDLRLLTEVDAQSPSPNWISIGGMEPSWVHYLGREIFEVQSSGTDDASWEAVRKFSNEHAESRIVIVGDDAHTRLEQLRAAEPEVWSFEVIASADRFLRPGQVSVLRFVGGPGDYVQKSHVLPEGTLGKSGKSVPARMVTHTTASGTNELSTQFPSLDPANPLLGQGPVDQGIGPLPKPLSEQPAENKGDSVGNQMRDRDSGGNELYNPLRPKQR